MSRKEQNVEVGRSELCEPSRPSRYIFMGESNCGCYLLFYISTRIESTCKYIIVHSSSSKTWLDVVMQSFVISVCMFV